MIDPDDLMDEYESFDGFRGVPAAQSPEAGAIGVIDYSKWAGDPPPRQYAITPLTPLMTTTILAGDGGTGKSLLAQQACTSVALGLDFLGMQTAPMRALYITCEDDEDELWRRQVAINSALDVTMDEIAGLFFMVSWTGRTDTAVATFDADGKLVRTARWSEIQSFVTAANIRFLVFDNVTDAMGGDMSDIHQVAQFVNLWTGGAIQQRGACLLIHHTAKSESSSYFGSVGFNNKVRSRLLFVRPDPENDPDLRKLINLKANYTASGGETAVRWQGGAFILDADLPDDRRQELQVAGRASADNDRFLACLREMTRQQRAVSEKPSPSYAPRKFADMAEAGGIGVKRMESAMDRLFRLGLIERGPLWQTDQRKQVYGLREVQK